MIDYYIGATTSAPTSVTLEIKDQSGQLVRRYSSADPVPTPDPASATPPYWIRPPQQLASGPGLHRFLWDLHYTPVPGLQPHIRLQLWVTTRPRTNIALGHAGQIHRSADNRRKELSQPLTL
jgi:hypothetical protein